MNEAQTPPTPGSVAIEASLLQAAYARKPLNVLMTVLAALLGGTLLWLIQPADALLAWGAALLLVSLLGALECLAYQSARPALAGPAALARWQTLFALQSGASGLAWSLGPVLLLASASGEQLALFVGTLLCVCAVAMNSMAEQRGAMQFFLLGALLPAATAAALGESSMRRLIGLVLVCGLLALLAVGRRSHQTLRHLLETELRLRANLDASQDAVVGMDAQGRITDWNRRAADLFGWTQAQALGQLLEHTIIPERYRAAHRQGLARYLATGEQRAMKQRIEIAALRRDGREFTVEVALTPLTSFRSQHFTAFITDISERKAAQERLALFRRVFDASTQLVSIMDRQGRGIYQNRAHQQELGYSDEEILGRHYSLTVAPENLATFEAEIALARRQGNSWTGQLLLQRKDGSRFIAINNIGFIKDADGRVLYVFNIFYDFSPELARRDELARAKEAAERANQAKSDFLSSMSHELRTPMNAILGFAQILEYDVTLGARQLGHVREILKAGRHLLALVNEVLDLAKIESGQMGLSLESVDLAQLLEDCRQLMQPLATTRGIQLAFDTPAMPLIQADRVRLKQVLLNLLSNAVKYNREGGAVRLALQHTAGRRLRISITDTGPGIAAEQHDQLFQPFNRLGAERSKIEGTGIGLSITRRLVELMGGTIGMDSEVGRGCCFWFELPLPAGPDDDSAQPPDPALPAPQPAAALPAQHTVLCIDDNPVNLRLVAQILGLRPAVQVLTAEQPGLGLELARRHRPALILLDIHLPVMDGYQVLRLLRANPQLRGIPVIAITASAMPQDLERGRAAGFDDYLTKPLDIGRFLQVVDQALARARPAAQA